jgi:hypothetical protein
MRDSEFRSTPRAGKVEHPGADSEANGRLDDRITADLAALRSVTAREVPDLTQIVHTVRQRQAESGPWRWDLRSVLMAQLEAARRRPTLAIGIAGLVVVLAAMVVPVSYQRVTGQDVVVSLSGANLGAQEIAPIARDLKSRLGSPSVLVDAEAGSGAPTWVLRSTSPDRSRTSVGRETGAFVKDLSKQGYTASLQVSPHMDRVKYPVAAYAWDQIIQISTDGKSAAQLESEIRQRLAEAGVPDAQVSVTDHPGGGREVSLKVERQKVGDAPTMAEPVMPQLQLTKDGAPIAGGFTVRVERKKIDGGPVTLVVNVTSEGKAATAQVPNADTMSDADVATSISSQLRQAGIDAKVTVVGGKIQIDPAK